LDTKQNDQTRNKREKRDTKMTKYQIEKQEQESREIKLCKQVAFELRELGQPWVAAPTDLDEEKNRRWHIWLGEKLTTGQPPMDLDRQRVWLGLGEWSKKGKVGIHPCWPFEAVDTAKGERQRYDYWRRQTFPAERTPTIYVSEKRGPKVIAKEIVRRLLPDYADKWAEAKAARDAWQESLDKKADQLQRCAEALAGCDPRRYNDKITAYLNELRIEIDQYSVSIHPRTNQVAEIVEGIIKPLKGLSQND
jgi:hypothetical protein